MVHNIKNTNWKMVLLSDDDGGVDENRLQRRERVTQLDNEECAPIISILTLLSFSCRSRMHNLWRTLG